MAKLVAGLSVSLLLACRVGFPADCQDLVTTGSRQWGWLGSALRVKIYDFAVYVDPKQVRTLPLSSQLPAALYSKQQRAACMLDAFPSDCVLYLLKACFLHPASCIGEHPAA